MTALLSIPCDIILATSHDAAASADPDAPYEVPRAVAHPSQWADAVTAVRDWRPDQHDTGQRPPFSYSHGIRRGASGSNNSAGAETDPLGSASWFAAVWNGTGYGRKRSADQLIGVFDVTALLEPARSRMAAWMNSQSQMLWKTLQNETASMQAEFAAMISASPGAARQTDLDDLKARGYACGSVAMPWTDDVGRRVMVAGNCPLVMLEYDVRAINAKGAGRKWYAWMDENGVRAGNWEANKAAGRPMPAHVGPAANWKLVRDAVSKGQQNIGIRGFEVRVSPVGSIASPGRRHIIGEFGAEPHEAQLIADAWAAFKLAKQNYAGTLPADARGLISAITEGISRMAATNESGRSFDGVPLMPSASLGS